MVEFIQNPRRSPRAPARCRVGVVSAHGTFDATTEDVGAHGCQLVSPRLVREGEPVQLELSHDLMKEPLRLAGRVAWTSERSPWRLGIAFDEGAHGGSTRWFERLLVSVPGLTPFRRIPDRIPVDSALYLASPPRFLVDFTPDEVALLRSIGSGAAVAELRAQLRDRWLPALRALFSLLAHNHVTLTRGGSVHPDAWKKILAEAESALAVESLRGGDPPPPVTAFAPTRPGLAAVPTPPPAAGTRPTLRAVPAPATSTWPAQPARAPTGKWPAAAPAPQAWPGADQVPAPPAPDPSAGQWSAPITGAWPAVPAAAAWAPAPASPPAPSGDEDPGSASGWLASAAEMMMPSTWAGGPAPRGEERSVDGGAPWSSMPYQPSAAPGTSSGFPPAGAPPAAPPPRSVEAQGCYERALAELQAGRVVGGTVLLRRALALAPGDPEIAGALASATSAQR